MSSTEFIAVPVEQHDTTAVTAAELDVRDELRRTDTKAIGLLGLFGVTLAGLLALIAANPSTFATVLLRLAAGPIGASVVVLLLVLRPVILRAGAHGLPRWSTYRKQPEALLEDLTAQGSLLCRVDVLADLSAVLITKYRRIRLAVHLLLTGLALLALASFTA